MGRPKKSPKKAARVAAKAQPGFLRIPADLGQLLVEAAVRRRTSVAAEIDPLLRPAVLAARRGPAPAEEGRTPVVQIKVAADLAEAARQLVKAGRVRSLAAFVGAAIREGVVALHLGVAAEMAGVHGKRLA